MKQFNGFDEAQKAAQASETKKLPAGAYVCKILGVKYEEGQNDSSDRIAIQFDITEGENKDFFKAQYNANTSDDKKWKGITRIYVPSDDGSDKDQWTKNTFARWTNAIEASNKGYSWDWDESKWKGKAIGLVFGPTGTIIEGKEVVYTEVHGPASVAAAREGSFYKKYLDLKKKNGYTGNQTTAPATSSDDFLNIPNGSEEEIPFD